MKLQKALEMLATISMDFPRFPKTGVPDYRRQIREALSTFQIRIREAREVLNAVHGDYADNGRTQTQREATSDLVVNMLDKFNEGK